MKRVVLLGLMALLLLWGCQEKSAEPTAPADLCLMDEPFKGLDEATRKTVMDTVLERTRSRTLLVVTHDPEEAAYLGGRIVRM